MSISDEYKNIFHRKIKQPCKDLIYIYTVEWNIFFSTPVLIVEVDGYAFHANNPEQLKRDHMKDEILHKYSIPIIRFGTNGSEEENKLRVKLTELVGKL